MLLFDVIRDIDPFNEFLSDYSRVEDDDDDDDDDEYDDIEDYDSDDDDDDDDDDNIQGLYMAIFKSLTDHSSMNGGSVL